jgi:hypothetical protein
MPGVGTLTFLTPASTFLPANTNLSNLSDRQHEAVVSEDKRLLVLAGAGSDKTKTLLQKIIYLIEEKGISPSGIPDKDLQLDHTAQHRFKAPVCILYSNFLFLLHQTRPKPSQP